MIVTFEETYLEELYTQGKANDKKHINKEEYRYDYTERKRSQNDSQQSEAF